MSDRWIVASLLISIAPLYARQQQSVAKLKADTRNAVGIIGGDKAKTQTYCQILDRSRQIHQLHEVKDQKKANGLVREIVQLKKQLPEYAVLSNAISAQRLVLAASCVSAETRWEMRAVRC